MELNQYFFGLIVSIGVIHLASVAVQYIGTFRSKRSLVDKSSLAKPLERDDWYVFFHCADLLGKEAASTSPDRPKHEQPATALPCKQASKQSARLRARL
jgi:hypothetical protein